MTHPQAQHGDFTLPLHVFYLEIESYYVSLYTSPVHSYFYIKLCWDVREIR